MRPSSTTRSSGRRGRGGARGGGRRRLRRSRTASGFIYGLEEPIATRSRRSHSASTAPTGSASCPRPRTRSTYTERGYDTAADLHGEDAPVALARSGGSLNAPTGFTVTGARHPRLHRRRLARRALGDMQTMPGLGVTPAARRRHRRGGRDSGCSGADRARSLGVLSTARINHARARAGARHRQGGGDRGREP